MTTEDPVGRMKDVAKKLRAADFDQWYAIHQQFVRQVTALDEELRQKYQMALAGFRVTTLSQTFHFAIGSDPIPEEIARMETLLQQHGIDPETVKTLIDARVTTIVLQTVQSMEVLLKPLAQ
ncbi:MAG: hypothetical protein PHE68_05400 [Candidatus Peribacteraceae bacterium]|nr:hypothetical protein [Candidatus Peribacteraceae bacterium]MDD5074493.1 hypothetical protein [Candidatus Peribacteraceae bacterium]